nr:ribonuclease H-like domain-containing protein [Tanacetum cinerariifolium]
MTRYNSNPIVPPKETNHTPVLTPNPEVKVYCRRTKVENLLSHLNFATINKVIKQGLARGLPKLKYEKNHLCSACSLRKSKKHTYKPKFEDSIQEKLYLLRMDLCGPIRIESINGKKYILVIVDDYLRFTWMKFLRSNDETPEFVIKFLKMIQVRLNVIVRNIPTDNGTEFFNQTLKSYYEDVGISHKTSVARLSAGLNTIKDDGVIKRLKFVNKSEDCQEYRRAIPDMMLTDEIKQPEAYKAFIGYSGGLIPPKKSRVKGSQDKKQTVIPKRKSSIFANDNIIHEPDVALELGKSNIK